MTTSNKKYFFETKEQYLAFREKWANMGNHTAAHHMFYNIIRGKDPQHGFTPFQRLSKITGMGIMNRGAVMASEELSRLNKSWMKDRKDDFLAPFGETFTTEDFDRFARDFLPEVPTITPTFGKGLQIYDRMVKGEIKPKTCEELMAIYNADEKEAA